MFKRIAFAISKYFVVILTFLGIGVSSNYTFAQDLVEFEIETEDGVTVNTLTIGQDGRLTRVKYEPGTPEEPVELIGEAKALLESAGICDPGIGPDAPTN